jgi:hypothetical protein
MADTAIITLRSIMDIITTITIITAAGDAAVAISGRDFSAESPRES